jgi:hypothetical protein
MTDITILIFVVLADVLLWRILLTLQYQKEVNQKVEKILQKSKMAESIDLSEPLKDVSI